MKLWTKSLMWDRSVKIEAACYLYVYTPRSTLYNFHPLEKLSKKPCFVFDAHWKKNTSKRSFKSKLPLFFISLFFLLFQTLYFYKSKHMIKKICKSQTKKQQKLCFSLD